MIKFFCLFFLIISCATQKSSEVLFDSIFHQGSCELKVSSFLRLRATSLNDLDSKVYELTINQSPVFDLVSEQAKMVESQHEVQIDFLWQEDHYQVITDFFSSDLPNKTRHPSLILSQKNSSTIYREYLYHIGSISIRLISDGRKIIAIERDQMFTCKENKSQLSCHCHSKFL
jgi:hypothetical protein